MLKEENGMRPKKAGMPRVVLTITDGESNIDKELVKVEADRLKAKEYNLIAVGIAKASIKE